MEELIIRSLQRRTSRAEEDLLRSWRDESREHEERYQEVLRIWELTAIGAPALGSTPPSVERLLAPRSDRFSDSAANTLDTVPSGREQTKATRTSRRSSRGWASGFRLVAAAAGLVALGFGLSFLGRDDGALLLSHARVVTGAGELTTVTLGDGSTIRLGPESRLELSETKDHRYARLDGRAFFGVQSDSLRPFSVTTQYGQAEVFGTRFEIRTEDDEFRVLVVEGSVGVSVGDSVIRLSESEMSTSRRGGLPVRVRVTDVFQHLDWLGNSLVFQATPVERAFREIERRYGVGFEIDDPSISRLTVTAAFTGQSVDDVVQIICEIIGARCERQGETIKVERLSPSARVQPEIGS